MDILIVHYNTPELTGALVRSIWKWCGKDGVRINVFDNSTERPFPETEGVRIWDNTRGQLIDFKEFLGRYPLRFGEAERGNDWASAKHCWTVDYCFDLLPGGFLLMDSDILLKGDVLWMADQGVAWSGWRRLYKTPRGVQERLWPFLCWLNVPMLREFGIRYFNENWMWKLKPGAGEYADTGAWVLKESLRAGLPCREVYIDDYMVHFGSASWGKSHSRQEAQREWLEKNRRYYED